MMELQEQQQKELYRLTKGFADTVKQLTLEIRGDMKLESSEKQAILGQIESREEIMELKNDARVLRIRELKSFKDYQIFLGSEKIEDMKRLSTGEAGEAKSLEIIQSELEVIGKANSFVYQIRFINGSGRYMPSD